ncbi:unnamed protein product [Leptosia nina]|uniref:Uncharacterized protein n=1 Tax=Leptosia nina TaxID=320188 RepID=A0AAV1K1R0_9NEOP
MANCHFWREFCPYNSYDKINRFWGDMVRTEQKHTHCTKDHLVQRLDSLLSISLASLSPQTDHVRWPSEMLFGKSTLPLWGLASLRCLTWGYTPIHGQSTQKHSFILL